LEQVIIKREPTDAVQGVGQWRSTDEAG